MIPAALMQDAVPQASGGPTVPPGSQDAPAAATGDAGFTTLTSGIEGLPNSDGQVWRTYDISPYTFSIPNTVRPEQAIVDWITRETGTDMWFSQPFGILSASGSQLHVYHTPLVHDRIKPIVDRFVQSRGAPQVFGLRLVTISAPDWRRGALTTMKPVAVNSPGVEAWLMSKENAAVLAGQLRNRADYQERNNGDLVIHNGQKQVLASTRPVQFTRNLEWINQGAGYYQPLTDRIEEGYSIDFSALTSLDGYSIEAMIGCKIDQIERLQSVVVQVPGAAGTTQTAELQIPQLVSWRLNERFRWPSDQVLVLGCGVVATPGPQREALLGIPALVNGTRGRAEALLFVEYKGRAVITSSSTGVPATGTGPMLPVVPR